MTNPADKSLPEACSKPPIMEFEGFIIRPFDGWHLWFENPHGEGTTIHKIEFLGLLVRFFEEKF